VSHLKEVYGGTMHKITAAILIGLGSLIIGSSALAEGEKVIICHAAGREGTTHYETLEISTNAVFKDQGGHFYENGTPAAGHEQDYLGPCQTDTTTTLSPTTTVTTTVPLTTTSGPSTTPAPTSTAPAATSTLSPSTTTASSITVALTTPVVPSTASTAPTSQTVTTTRTLPETGDNTGHLALIALGLTLIGGGAIALARRR
jgi:LPXTG-motif cell wall-anchored protein